MLGNFQAVSAITEGLCSEYIKALDLTWANVDKRPFRRLRDFIGPKTNFEALCTAHDALSRSKPCVPFIRTYFPTLFSSVASFEAVSMRPPYLLTFIPFLLLFPHHLDIYLRTIADVEETHVDYVPHRPSVREHINFT